MSPLLLFPAVWVLGVALAQVPLVDLQRPWSLLVWIVVAVVPIAFVIGGVLGRSLVASRVAHTRAPPTAVAPSRRRRMRWALGACLVIGYAELAHQFAGAGTIPLFSSNIDAARFAQPGGPTIVLTDLLTVAVVTALAVPSRLLSRSALVELAVAAIALFGYALAGGRLLLVVALASAVIARSLRGYVPRAVVVFGAAVTSLALISGLFFLRTSQHPETPFEREIYERVLPATPAPLRPLVPLHLGVALNFEALARVVEFFPEEAPYGHGAYNALAFDLAISQARDLGTITSQLSGPWVTSTVAGPLWADGGLPLVAAGMVLIGFVSTAAYTLASRTKALRHALPGGYLVFLAAFGFYHNTWTQNVDWLLVAPLLFAMGLLAGGRRPPQAVDSGLPPLRPRRRHLGLVLTALALIITGATAFEFSGLREAALRETSGILTPPS
jgi:hypothetical protein